jgi:hypothetical protein
MNRDALISEARARIIWGEPHEAVCEFLTSNGVSAMEAAARIQAFKRERNAEIRGRGLQSTLIGIALLVVTSILLYLAFGGPEFGGDIHSLAFCLAAGCYGLWKLTTGIIYLLRPQAEDGPTDQAGE